ncbi:MAG: NADH-quinone oxidoreductase subunit N, partial [Limisphaerales bacterium]
VIAALAATSILVGNLLAIAQSNVRRLIAYSAIAHAGYVLIALLARSHNGVASAVFYLFTYGLAVIGIFGVIGLIEESHGELSLKDLRGLSGRSPLLALCLLVFVLSLAGIPPLAGFFGKFYIFIAALETSLTAAESGLLWIVVLAIAGSAVSLYYYLQILKQAFVVEDTASPSSPISATLIQKLTISILAAAVIASGCFPNVLLRRLEVPGSNAPTEHQDLHDHHQHETALESSHLFADLR